MIIGHNPTTLLPRIILGFGYIYAKIAALDSSAIDLLPLHGGQSDMINLRLQAKACVPGRLHAFECR